MLKIKSITFKNHIIFGNKKLDFTLHNGNAADNIIIVGENGSGKTNLIKELLKFIHADKNMFNKIKNVIDNIEIELTFKRSDLLIPSIDFENKNIDYLKQFNDLYIATEWKNKILDIKKINENAYKQDIINGIIAQLPNLKFMNFFNDSKFSNKFYTNNKNVLYDDINTNENYKKWIYFINNMKKNKFKINLKISDFSSAYSSKILCENENDNFVLNINEYSIFNEISFKLENYNSFNSIIFWYDNLEYVWDKIIEFMNKLIKNKDIKIINSDLEEIDLFEENTINYLNKFKIIDKNLFYENNDVIKDVYKWIQNNINNLLSDININEIVQNLGHDLYEILKPLTLSIQEFFNDHENDIKINKVNFNGFNKKYISFTKNKKEIDFESFSSGEKLILSICMTILKKLNINIFNNEQIDESEQYYRIINKGLSELIQSHTILLFDEIESGLHPKWQSKILNLIKNTTQNVGQRFLTTHSPIVCYSINPETDIIINLKDKDDVISFKNYTSIQDCVNQSLNFDYRELSDEHDLWVEGESDKLYFDIAKKQNKELIPFNILANKHSENECGFSHLSGSDFIIKNILINFLFNEDEKNRKRNLIAILDGDVLKKSYSMNFILDFFSKEEEKIKIKNNINNWDELENILENSQNNKDNLNTILLNIKNKNNDLFQLFILKEDSIEFYLEFKNDNEEFKSLLNNFKHKQCDISDKECKESKQNIKINIEQIIQNDNSELVTTNIDKIFAEIKNSLNKD